MKKLSTRAGFGLVAAVCAGLLAFAYYLQYVQHLEPCPLCYAQRLFFYAMLAVFVVAALHGRGAPVYGCVAALFAAGGIAAAGRQVWLQHLPADKVPQCGPDLIFMLKNFPLGETLSNLVEGSGECAKVDWSFLGLSIAEWSLAWFVLLASYALWLGFRRSNSAPAAAAAASR